VRRPFADSPEFLRLIAGERPVDLARVALEIALDADPSVDIDACLNRIASLADRVRERCPSEARPKSILGQINWVLFVEEGFRGNEAEYYDPRNSYLNEVLDRRAGIPISLSVLYARVAAPLGVELGGVDLPAHFMLRLAGSEPPLFVDAFHSGALLDRAGCVRQVSRSIGRTVDISDDRMALCDSAATVARMLRNLKAIHLRAGDYATALPVARRLAAVEPANLEEVRDWGLLAYQTGHPGEAIEPLSRYAAECGDAPDASTMNSLLRTARREMAQNN
jgi:regulator of sirC expression with transglutaminase-like and TPR domain